MDPQTNEKFVPHVIEPTWGVDRSVLVTLLEAYTEDTTNERTYLKLPYWTAPYKVAVFPLLANKPALVEKARSVYDELAACSLRLPSISVLNCQLSAISHSYLLLIPPWYTHTQSS
jgi:glycyl-tRNA synthetase